MAEQTLSGDIRQHSNTLNYIGRLLNEDWFLRKVLSHLVDDGLHECRRVCREWNAVCKTLPVKLRKVPPEHLGQVLAISPNAVEVSCTPCFPPNDLDIARQLAGISSLKHLNRLDYSDAKHSDDLQFIHPETYTRLQSLGVYLNKASCDNFRNALSYLTGLYNLEVLLTENVSRPRSWTPFTELKRLRELCLSSRLLRNRGNQIMFPSTALTKLTVDDRYQGRSSTSEELEAVAHYADTIRSFTLRRCMRILRIPSTTWTALERCGRLEVLNMVILNIKSNNYLHSHLPNVASIASLEDLTLDIECDRRHLKIGSILSSLTNLQSLNLTISRLGRRKRVSVCVSYLTRLTSLTLRGASIEGSIDHLNKLTRLFLDMMPVAESEDLSHTLMQMAKLEELNWYDWHLPAHPDHVICHLKNLRRLSLATEDDLDLEFMQRIALLPQLTGLGFWNISRHKKEDSFWMQFTVLTQLHELHIRRGPGFDVLGVFAEGSFPRLRYLEISYPKLEKNEEWLLFRRFPCLRSFKRFASLFEENVVMQAHDNSVPFPPSTNDSFCLVGF